MFLRRIINLIILQEAHSCVEKAAMIGFVKLRILEPGFYLDHSFLDALASLAFKLSLTE